MAEAPTARGQDLTQGPIFRTMLVFALPVLGTSVVQSLNGSINAMWVGRMLGERAVAATGNSNQILFLLLAAVFGVGLAATILVGQAFGRKDIAGAKRVVGTIATFFAVFSVALAVAGWLLTETMLRALGTPPEALPLAVNYLHVIFIALPLMYFATFVSMALRGSGDSRTPFLFTCLGAALDIVLNPLLIGGGGPVPALGIAGSAWATFISQSVALAGLLAYAYHRRSPIRLTREELGLLRPDPRLLRAAIVKGIPMGLQMIVVGVSGIAMIRLVNGYGVTTTAAYNVAAQLWTYIQMPALSIGAAASSFAAQNIGAGKWDRVNQTARAGVLMNLALTGALILAVYGVEHRLVRLFLPADAAAWRTVYAINAAGLWGYMFLGASFVLFAVVRATGAVWPPLAILAVALVGFRIPAAYLLEPTMGVDAVWWTAPISMMIAMVLAALYYRSGRWRSATMAGAPPGAAPAAASQSEARAVPATAPARA